MNGVKILVEQLEVLAWKYKAKHGGGDRDWKPSTSQESGMQHRYPVRQCFRLCRRTSQSTATFSHSGVLNQKWQFIFSSE